MTDQNSNPFLSLLGTSEGTETPSDANKNSEQKATREPPSSDVVLSEEIREIAEDVFFISLTKNNPSIKSGRVPYLVYLSDVAPSVQDESYTDVKILKIAIFERILLAEPSSHLIKLKKTDSPGYSHVTETKCVLYLFECYKILKAKLQSGVYKKDVDQVVRFVVDNVITALRQPELFENQDIHEQVNPQ